MRVFLSHVGRRSCVIIGWIGCVSEARSLDPTRRERPGHMKIERFGLSPFSTANILELLQSVFGSRQGML
jgi:hypothetical protein